MEFTIPEGTENASFTPPNLDVFYRARIMDCIRINPKFEEEKNSTVVAFCYLLFDNTRKEYRSYAESVPLNKKPDGKFLKICSALTGKRVTAKNLPNSGDTAIFVGKQYAIKFASDARGKISILLREFIKPENRAIMDTTQFQCPAWVTRSAYSTQEPEFEGDAMELLKDFDLSVASADLALPSNAEPEIDLTPSDTADDVCDVEMASDEEDDSDVGIDLDIILK